MAQRSRPAAVAVVVVATVVCVLCLIVAGGVAASQWERHSQPGMNPDLRLHVGRSGDTGSPVLFIHGLGGAGGYFLNHAGKLAEHRLIAPDLLGFGASPKPLDARYDVDEQVARLLFTLGEELEGRKTVLVGHSFGAVVALALAARRPELFAGVVVLGLPVYATREQGQAAARRLGGMEAGILDDSLFWELTCNFHTVYRRLPLAAAFGVPDDVYEDGTHHVWESLGGTLRHVLEVDVAQLARTVAATTPLLLIHGDTDPISPTENAVALARDIGARVVLLPGGHHVFLTNPATPTTIEGFIDDLDVGRAH